MTQEDQYAIIGKAHEDYKAAKTKLSAIEARGRTISEAARNLAEAILEPTRVIVVQEGESATVAGIRGDPFFFGAEVAKQLSPDYVRQHVAEYRATKQQVAALRQHLVGLGQNPGD